ncbi:DUF3093 domain-containing protein [Devriesea agamarum]|uniref:DUF3093 domain-containing protein n=1 Tax=Devriesea agamarum TaxID=472569 RepID=UPI00071C30F3|nr:DUF3093 domain-containing protein [Devriesea agamarum]
MQDSSTPPSSPPNDASHVSSSPSDVSQSHPAPLSEPIFSERVTPSGLVWFIGGVFGAAFGLIMVPVSPMAALITGIIGLIIALVVLWFTSPVIRVDKSEIAAGRARIPLSLLGEAEIIERERIQALMGPEIKPLAYHCFRASAHRAVVAEVLDPEDPTPYWLISTRRPEELQRAMSIQTSTAQ